jgi:hypothetical protein
MYWALVPGHTSSVILFIREQQASWGAARVCVRGAHVTGAAAVSRARIAVMSIDVSIQHPLRAAAMLGW